MKRSLLATSAVISLVLPALATSCALDEVPPPATSGGKSGGGGAMTSNGGGGASGGNTITGGSGGSGATTTTGGSGGSSGGSGGAPGGSGGIPGGTGGTGGGSEPVTVDTFAGTPNEFGFAFKDSFLMVPCYSVSGVDCLVVTGECPNTEDADFEARGYVFSERFTMGGTPDKNYDVTIQVSGIAEGKFYTGGTRQRGADSSSAQEPAGTDTWYTGGQAIESWYNVYKLTVFQADGTTEVQHYYFNSYPQDFLDAESHRTFPIAYEATFEVPGGAVLEYLIGDSNCRAINNCGPGDNGSACPAERQLPNDPVAVPDMYGGIATTGMNVVNGSTGPWHAQMIHVTVTNVVEK